MSKDPIDIACAKAALDSNYILLFTTNSVERDAVYAILTDSTSALIHRDHRGARIGKIDGRFCIHLNGSVGAQDQQSIGSLCRWMMQQFFPQPQFIIAVGFAWGNPAVANPGDIIVASEICDISHQRTNQGRRTRRVVHHKSPIGFLEDFIKKLPDPAYSGRILTGPLASAEIYLADDNERDEIIQQLPDILGGEMEAFDLVRDLKLPWLLVKAISDNGGNSVGRENQESSAQAAANLIAPILNTLKQDGVLSEPRRNATTDRLTDALIGEAVRISRPTGDRNAILDAMNSHVPRLIQRLSGYASDSDANGMLAEILAVMIAELAQNAFIHGDASHASCGFTPTSITLSDDGTHYDPLNLSGTKGGASAWKEFDEEFLKQNKISFSQRHKVERRGNSYKFKLVLLSAEIRKAKQDCMLIPSRTASPRNASAFIYDSKCETLYYDAGDIFTISKAFSIESELMGLLQAGKSLLIACRNQRQVQIYQGALSEFAGPKLRIFVGSRL